MTDLPGTLDHSSYLQRRYFAELDGIRALSVLLVITVHMYDAFWEPLAGHLGVVIFFVLSGYLITTLALREEDKYGRLSLAAFFVRRSYRIFPLYYGVLLLYAVLILVLGIGGEKREAFLGALPYYLVYLQEIPYVYGVGGSYQDIPFYQSWSLGIEEKFYLFWPLLAFVVWRGKPSVRITGTCLLIAAFVVTYVPGQAKGILFPYYHILVGCLAAFVLHRPDGYQRCMVLARTGLRYPLLLLMTLVHFTVPHEPAAVVVYSPLVAAVMVSLVIRPGKIGAILSLTPLVAVGRLAYGIYLTHLICRNVVDRVIPTDTEQIVLRLGAYVATCTLSIGVAYLLFHAIEKPLIAVGRAWSDRILQREPPQAVASAMQATTVEN